jgi:hypothetical protein
MKHEFTQGEIATACNEYVLKHHYPAGTWVINTNVETITLNEVSHHAGPLKPEEIIGQPLIFRIVVDVTKKEPET